MVLVDVEARAIHKNSRHNYNLFNSNIVVNPSLLFLWIALASTSTSRIHYYITVKQVIIMSSVLMDRSSL
jgi:hypothetical protein